MTESGNKVVSSDFLRVLLALKQNTMRDNNVAEVAQVTNVTSDTLTCTLLSNANTYVNCIKLQNLDIKKDDIVLIVFTNKDFRQNLNRIKNNQKPIDNQAETLHSLSYGIVVGLVYRKSPED